MCGLLQLLLAATAFQIVVFATVPKLAPLRTVPKPVSLVKSTPETLERTRALSVFFASLQCISTTDPDEQIIREIQQNFNPLDHLEEYNNPEYVQSLLQYITRAGLEGKINNNEFPTAKAQISELGLIILTLYANSNNWPLFYNTSVWLIDKVNGAQLYWAVRNVVGEILYESVVLPTAVEVFPQNFINKKEIGRVAGLTFTESELEHHPLQYFTSDPGINEFHMEWHIDNPYWWDAELYGVKRDRKGELFLFMHHQVLQRVNAELLSNRLPEIPSLKLDPDYVITEGYYPDVVTTGYRQYLSRKEGELLKEFDENDDGKFISTLKIWLNRLTMGIEEGYFRKSGNIQVSLHDDNASDILGATIEASWDSVNTGFYSSLHNYLHVLLAGMMKSEEPDPPGVEAFIVTSLRDPSSFFRIHGLVDEVYFKLKSKLSSYTKEDLEYTGVEISVNVVSLVDNNYISNYNTNEATILSQTPVLTTYMANRIYDISTAARPTCRGIGQQPLNSVTRVLDHYPFEYFITIKSSRDTIGYGMVRIFLLPETSYDGSVLTEEESHYHAIQLDILRIQLEPSDEIMIRRSSLESSVTKYRTAPGIKTLFRSTESSLDDILSQKTRACGFPHNLLIPKGTVDGLRFKLIVMISEESKPDENDIEYPNFPYCGSLNGYLYPDKRPMGFPFDRPGTRFTPNDGDATTYKNVYQMPIIIQHRASN